MNKHHQIINALAWRRDFPQLGPDATHFVAPWGPLSGSLPRFPPSWAHLGASVLDTVNNFIEHPRLVAQRLLTYANIVGRDRVMAATDCGFETFAGFGAVHPPICFAKLASMAEGAEIASKELWQ